MASDKITIDRELFERLTNAAIELEGEWHWKAGEMRRGHAETLDKLAALVREAVAIRDAPPQADLIADIREAQRKIVEHVRTSPWHVLIDAWRSGSGHMYLSVDDPQDKTRGVVREFYSSRCLLVQIAEAIDEWKRINLPATGKSE